VAGRRAVQHPLDASFAGQEVSIDARPHWLLSAAPVTFGSFLCNRAMQGEAWRKPMKQFLWRFLALSLVVAGVAGVAAVSSAQAGPAEIALLSNYIGEWSGSSSLVGGAKPEPFSCRLTINKGNESKINYAGRCTLTTMNLSVTGTIAFDDATHTYQAIMGSNVGYKGTAVGRISGDKITFDLSEKQSDRAGNGVKLGAQIALIGSNSINVNYHVEFNDSGKVLTASVPFAK
jgi:hypothetical protein